MKSSCCRSILVLIALALLAPMPALGQGFAAGISPALFELRARPGQVLRDTVTVANPGKEPASYAFRTADWRLSDTGSVEYFEDELLEGSCRPWVKLERRAVSVRADGRKRYRFEVHVPEDAESGLCRFAILIEPEQQTVARLGENGEMQFPIVGRYAVITYVTIGDARADIEYLGMGEQTVNNLRLPTLKLHNEGNTLDRAFGEVVATDAAGRRTSLIASSFPILPDRTEEIVLAPRQPRPGEPPVSFDYPLQLKGRVEVTGQTIRIDQTFN
jgi:hypothetical protein